MPHGRLEILVLHNGTRTKVAQKSPKQATKRGHQVLTNEREIDIKASIRGEPLLSKKTL
jgi:hypothetical protein